ncbi:SWIM zinc finger family protein [Streptomyces marokkonensis]|uniref:SWIM zinc finger family protein n=1 Tax=Streptomyces marokkonensis TaxID=324855 RepID=UPI0011F355F8|nr:SWIM zinc finger family protein [Streptomyces marokkonensis]
MTPRPSDEAREALRAARARTTREPAATDTPEHRPAPDQPAAPAPGRPDGTGRPGPGHRPGDAAREALRQAVRARRGTEGPGDAAEPDREDTGAPATEGGAPSEEGPHGDAPPPAGPSVSGDTEAPAGGAAGHHAPRRPGDIAREALRSAREEAPRARPAPGGRATDAEPLERRAPSPRVPRTTHGDRAADSRAREVRESLRDAFRLPGPDPESDVAPGRGGAPATRDDARPPGGRPATRARDGAAEDAGAGPSRTPRDTAPPVPATPRSMAAPARDGDLRRTFPAFPPRTPGGEGFAGTWWGRAWVTALEDGALDPARLARGRAYAEQGHVDAITVTPGLVLAYVRGSRPRPYRVQVRLRTFGDADWERFLDAAAERPGHIAALLDGDMPQTLADCGVPLLPASGDLDPRCSCPDSGHPCKHAAALCYQTARLLDSDPFVLLLLRGRGEREVIDALSRLSAARAARAAQGREPEPLPGIRAADAVARRGRELPPLPAPLPPPAHPEQPPVYPASPGGPDPFALDQLATDAAARAHALLTTGRDPVGRLTLWQDAVRLAAARPGSGLTAATRTLYSSLARAAGRSPAELARAVAAWRQGGPAGLAVLEEPWDPPAGRFDRARPLLRAADLPAFRPRHNRLTHPRGHVQLRLGRDNLWYAYESEPDHDDWWPRGTPDPDPVGALTGLDAPGDL